MRAARRVRTCSQHGPPAFALVALLEWPHVRVEVPVLINMPVKILPVPVLVRSAALVEVGDLIGRHLIHPRNVNVPRVAPPAPSPDANAGASRLTITPKRDLAANLAKEGQILPVSVQGNVTR